MREVCRSISFFCFDCKLFILIRMGLYKKNPSSSGGGLIETNVVGEFVIVKAGGVAEDERGIRHFVSIVGFCCLNTT